MLAISVFLRVQISVWRSSRLDVFVSTLPLFPRTSALSGWGRGRGRVPAPLQCDLIRTDCVCNCPVSKEGQSLGPGGQDFGVGISEPRDSACTSVAAVRRDASTGRAVSPFPVRVLSACVIRFPRPSHARPGGQSGLGKRGPASALRGWGGPAAAPLGP